MASGNAPGRAWQCRAGRGVDRAGRQLQMPRNAWRRAGQIICPSEAPESCSQPSGAFGVIFFSRSGESLRLPRPS